MTKTTFLLTSLLLVGPSLASAADDDKPTSRPRPPEIEERLRQLHQEADILKVKKAAMHYGASEEAANALQHKVRTICDELGAPFKLFHADPYRLRESGQPDLSEAQARSMGALLRESYLDKVAVERGRREALQLAPCYSCDHGLNFCLNLTDDVIDDCFAEVQSASWCLGLWHDLMTGCFTRHATCLNGCSY